MLYIYITFSQQKYTNFHNANLYIHRNFIILINIDNIKLIINLMLNVILRIFTFLFHNYKNNQLILHAF